MKTKILSILALLLTVNQGAWAQTLPTDGTGAYLISSVDNWNTFCEDVNGGITYSGKTVKLTQNVGPVTTMAGGDTSFSGTFDGQGYTLTASINVQNDDMGTLAAPFPAISGATIKNLHVAGNISVNRARPASIASFVNDDSEITNCKSSVSITASRNDWVDAGGFVARVNAGKALTMTGCTFAGSITYSDANGYEGGGMVGWTQTNASANLTNCVFAPTSVSFANSKSKADNNFRMLVGGVGSSTLTRCYYNDVAANNTKIITDGEGKQARSISAGTDVTSLGISGASTEYNVSGITAYAHGIKYGGVYYAGNGDEVSLALSHADAAEGYSFNEYTATAGTLSGTTLTMPDANVTINATWTAIPTYTVTVKSGTEDAASWQGKAGTGDYQSLPLEGVAAGTAVSVKYSGTKMVKSVKARKKAAGPEVTTFSELQAALSAGKDVKLMNDIECTAEIEITSGALTIDGNGKTLSTTSAIRAFKVGSSATVAFKNLTLTGFVSGGGPAINNNGGTIVLDGCTISNCHVSNSGQGGGAIENKSNGKLYAINTTFSGNYSGEIGGAINNYGGSLYMSGCTFTDNYTTKSDAYWGGAIGINGGSEVRLINCSFSGNKYGTNTGTNDIGVYNNPTNYTIAGCTGATIASRNGDITTNASGTATLDYSDLSNITFTYKLPVTVTWNSPNFSSSTSQDGVTLTTTDDAAVGNNFYNNGANTFTTTLGKFTKIEIVCTSGDIDGWTKETAGKYQPHPDINPDKWKDLYKLTWTGDAESVTIQEGVYGIQSITFTIQ